MDIDQSELSADDKDKVLKRIKDGLLRETADEI
jgi:hypothetical protein